MRNILDLVLSSVDLNSYSASSGFIGFSERSVRFKSGMAESAVKNFASFFSSTLNQMTIVSSQCANTDELGFSGDLIEDAEDVAIVGNLFDAKLIRKLSFDREFGTDYNSSEYRCALDKNSKVFQVFKASAYDFSLIERLLVASMVVYGLHGHCFIVFEDLELIFYPHDDIGFGIIATGAKAKLNVARNFLKCAGDLSGFRSKCEV